MCARAEYLDIFNSASTDSLGLNWGETVAQLQREDKKTLMNDVEINGIWYSLLLHIVPGGIECDSTRRISMIERDMKRA